MKVLRGMSLALVIIVNIILLLTGSGTAQAIMLRLSLDDISVNADTIVVGTVISKTSQWNAERTHINTTVVIAVEDTFKGAAGQKTVTVTVPGGTVDGMTEWVEHAAVFQPGERSVVFLKRLSDSRHEVYGQQQGRHPVVDGKVGGVALAEFKGRVSRAVQRGASALTAEIKEPVGPLYLDVSKLSPPTQVPQQTTTKSPGWQTILSEGFGGAFPGVWQVAGDPSTGGHTWGQTSYTYHSAPYSVWCAGSVIGATGNYADNMNAWMVYGPFSLADASAAELTYWRWRYSEANADYFKVLFSTDGRYFYGYRYSGQGDTWDDVYFDLRDWYYLGNLTGRSQVWIAFVFQSNASVTYKGVFLDDVVVRKYVGAVPQITSITPSSASAGTSSNVTISGSGFGTTPGTVEFYYQSGEPNIPGSIVSWSNTSIVTTVPTGTIGGYNATASSGPVWVVNSEGGRSMPYPFTVTFSYGGRKWAGDSPVVNYRVNPNTPDTTGEEVAVQNAAATWTAAAGKSFAFNYAGSTAATASTQNFVNEVLWSSLLPTGVLAWARYWWDGTGNIVETDIEFNETYTWTTSGTPAADQYDVQTIALHEMGHWLNLRDMYGDWTGFPMDSDKVMFGYGGAGATKRSLHTADIAGIRWIYPSPLPAVITDNASNVAAGSTTLNGTLAWIGNTSNVSVSFQWGLTDNYTSETSTLSLNTLGLFSIPLTGLSENTTYHFRARAVGSSGTAYGADKTFKTFTTALPAPGNPYGWGWNQRGQLGDNTTTHRFVPVPVANLTGVVGVSGGDHHSLALKPEGTVWAWGGNTYGQLGDNTTTDRHVPVPVANLTAVTAISAGGSHSLALLSDGTVRAWGYNGQGQLGDNTTTHRFVPVPVANLTGVIAVSAGGYRSLALLSDGTVWSWGWNYNGQLGDNTTTERHTPVQVLSLRGVTAIDAGGSHSLALLSDGTVWAWGGNGQGQVGDNSTTNRHVPVPVANLTGVIAVSGGGMHSLALKPDGTVRAWGWNGQGELGDNSTTDRFVPVPVANLTGVIAVSGGKLHSLALKSDGTVWAWGYNGQGQLGDNTTSDRHVPVPVANLTGIVAIGAYNHSLALAGIPPSVTTDNATEVSGRSALLNATVTSLGSSSNATVSFQYGLTTNYTAETPGVSVNATGPFTAFLSGLSENTTYHYRAKAVGLAGTGYGADRTFTTPVVNVLRDLPPFAAKGQTFQVSINFTAPAGGFSSLGLSDFVPSGWTATANKLWNTPVSDQSLVVGNRVDYLWYSEVYAQGTTFTASYNVTVPAGATPGWYKFTGSVLEYYGGTGQGPFTAGVGGDSTVEIVEGARIEGVTRGANGDLLIGTTVTLDGAASATSDASGIYRVTAATLGPHTLVASTTGYRNVTKTVNVTDLTATYTVDFKGPSGLVPNAPDLSYVLACVNKWKFPGTEGLGLSLSKVLSVVNAWKFPV